jgi:hypothetical protein
MRFLLFTASLAFAADHHAAQRAVEGRLLSQYQLSDLNPGRPTIGSIVIVTKAGLEASPVSVTPTAGATWDHGRMKPTFSTTTMNWQLKMPVNPGQRVYITKIEAKDTHVVFDLSLPEAVNGVYFRGTVHFDFGKGYLNSPDFALIDRTVHEVLQIERPPAVTRGGRPQPRGGGGGGQPSYGATPNPPPPSSYTEPLPPPPVPPPASPAGLRQPSQAANVTPGMSAAQVKAALGPPDRVVKFGSKEVQYFGNLKVTILDGKVTDVVRTQP